MKKYPNVRKFLSEHPWAILPARLDVIIEILEMRAAGRAFTDEEIQARIGGLQRPAANRAGTIAVLPLHGVIAPRMNAMTDISGGTSAEQFGALMRRAVGDPDVSAIVMDVDSPGGSVFAVEELAATIHSLRGRKPIVAVANTMMASAAYWIASQADEIVASPSSQVGSIGVIAVHQDLSAAEAKLGVKTTYITAGRFKSEAAPGVPLTDEAREAMQSLVDQYYGAFTRDVARGRGVKVSAVQGGYGEGRVVSAAEAVKLGMVDRVGTLADAIERVALGARRSSGVAAIARTASGALVAADPVEPDQDGNCPDGYEKGDDGMCHLMTDEEAKAKAGRAEIDAFRQRLAAHA